MTIFYYTTDEDISKPSFHKVQNVDKAKDDEACVEDYWEHRPDQKAWLYNAVTYRKRMVVPTDVPGGPDVENLQRGEGSRVTRARYANREFVEIVDDWEGKDGNRELPSLWTGVTIFWEKGRDLGAPGGG